MRIATWLAGGLLLATAATAQLTLRWMVEQDPAEVGWCWIDLNGDGVRELIKEDGVGCFFFDGADGYSLLWSVIDPEPEEGVVFQLWQAEGSRLVFLRQNLEQQSASLRVVEALGGTLWSTPVLEGSISQGGIGDLDGDGSPELAWSWHRWEDEAWTSGWSVRHLDSGAELMPAQTVAGYLVGPWVGDIEGDSRAELLLNWYDGSGQSQLLCWGTWPTAVGDSARPEAFGMRAWPNPFNPSCRIAFGAPATGGELRVVDATGRLVRRLPLAAGALEAHWDGLSQSGRPAASGVYWLQAEGRALPVTLLR
jgi:hypothetical protein